MKNLSATVAQLAAMRAKMSAPVEGRGSAKLKDLVSFGSNPGGLSAKVHVPDHLSAAPALVVVLHGCTQSAEGYNRGSGWSALADKHGFVLLFPEQQRANNPNLCFNWFSPADQVRDRGEALSIRQMIESTIEANGVDRSRIFVTGLSAGGAMASIMLASYPEVFAGGAIIAGLPYGSAANVSEALEAMRSGGRHRGEELGDRVRRASGHEGSWPSISIWHGTADATVSKSNADALVGQWLSVHGIADQPTATETIAGHSHRVWNNASGRAVVEDYRIANMGHGTPLATKGEEACGLPMPHMLDAGISSTYRIAASWNLLQVRDEEVSPVSRQREEETARLPVVRTARLERISPIESQSAPSPASGVEKIIGDALRAAGLMR